MSMVTVVVVNYNTREDLARCLTSVRESGPEAVIVADNGSTDGSREMVEDAFSEVTLLRLDENPGYGGAANAAIAHCSTPYALLLNSDTVLRADTVDALAAHLDAHPRAAVVGPRLLNPDGTLQPSCYPFPGSARWVVDNDDVSRLLGWVPGGSAWGYRTWAHDRDRVVPWVKGAALAIRVSAFEAVGGFDPAYFMYHEETDLCFRLRSAGWEVGFTPDTEVVHTGGTSTGQVPVEMAVALYRSAERFHRTHYTGLHRWVIEAAWRGLAAARHLGARRRQKAGGSEEVRAAAAREATAFKAISSGTDNRRSTP